VSFAERLILEPQREKSGETGYERYDYQALWGLALIFEHHGSHDDYAIAFEFHDDVVLFDSASSPMRARFYQVKTKGKGHWTLSDLYRRNTRKGDPSGGKLPSHIGKLLSNYVIFPDETEELNFVSNVPCKFLDASLSACHFTTCDAGTVAQFISKLKQEHSAATPTNASLIRYVRADLSLHDSSAHIKGKLANFVVEQIGSVEYNPDTLYKTIVEECRTRSKYTGGVSNFTDLIKFKSITRSQVEGWLDQVRSLTFETADLIDRALARIKQIEPIKAARVATTVVEVDITDAGVSADRQISTRVRDVEQVKVLPDLGMSFY
jgi:hypothetical protein